MNNDQAGNSEERTASFQKIWLETLMKMMQVGCTITPTSPPPEVFRHVRTGILEALAESWDQFLRSPQFLEAMKQWTEQTVTLRKMSNEILSKVRHEVQAPARDDIDTVMLAVRHMEKRLLDRMEQLSSQVTELKSAARRHQAKRPVRRQGPRQTRAAVASTVADAADGKE